MISLRIIIPPQMIFLHCLFLHYNYFQSFQICELNVISQIAGIGPTIKLLDVNCGYSFIL